MRSIKTFILHLYMDAYVPERVCGDVRALEEDDGVPFKNILELENVLRRFIFKSPTATGTRPESNQQQKNEFSE